MSNYLKQIIENKNWNLLNKLIKSGIVFIDDELIDYICSLPSDVIYECLSVTPSINYSKIEERILKLSSSDILYNYCLNFVGPDERFKKALLKYPDASFNYAKNILKHHDEDIFNLIFKQERIYSYLSVYAKEISGAPIERLGEIVLSLVNAKFLVDFLKIEALKDYPELVVKIINRLKELNDCEEIENLINYLDNKIFNFTNTYLYNYLDEICSLSSAFDFKRLHTLISKLHSIQIIDRLHIILDELKIKIPSMNDDEKMDLLIYLSEAQDYYMLKKYQNMFQELFQDKGQNRVRNI